MTTATPTAPPEPQKQASRQRGRESALDMVRSLGLCLLVVVPIWFLAQPPKESAQPIRVVDQAPEVSAWRSASPDAAPAPGALPEDWQPTVSQYVRQPVGLRLGWNTGGGSYVEFAATTGPSGPFITELTGAERPEGSLEVDGTSWQRYVESDGSVSLVRTLSDVTVVVGTLRSSASDDELLQLARSVRP